MDKDKGFSLIEVMVVVVISAALICMAVPSFVCLTDRSYARSYMNKLESALRYARVSAIKFAEPVLVCGGTEVKLCGSNWQEGAIVKIRSNNKILRVLPPIRPTDKLIWRGSFGVGEGITFLPTGFSYGQQGSFYYYANGLQLCKITVNLLGRVRSADY